MIRNLAIGKQVIAYVKKRTLHDYVVFFHSSHNHFTVDSILTIQKEVYK